MSRIRADQGYTGSWADWVQTHLGCTLEVVARPTEEEHRAAVWAIVKQRLKEGIPSVECWRGLSLVRKPTGLPGRWMIERTFAWLLKSRLLSKDCHTPK